MPDLFHPNLKNILECKVSSHHAAQGTIQRCTRVGVASMDKKNDIKGKFSHSVP